MSIVTLASDSWSRGAEVARKSAEALDYRLLVDDEMLTEAARRHGVQEGRLRQALFDPPSLLGMSRARRLRNIAYLQATVADALLEDKAVYHGPFGHLLLPGVAHVIRVRVTADQKRRLDLASSRDRLPASRARRSLRQEERQRRFWTDALCRLDTDAAELYDLVIDTTSLDVAQAVQQIVEAAGNRRFAPTTYSRERLAQLALETRVRAALVGIDPGVRVRAEQGQVTVQTVAPRARARRRTAQIQEQASGVDGVTSVQVEVVPDRLSDIARSMR